MAQDVNASEMSSDERDARLAAVLDALTSQVAAGDSIRWDDVAAQHPGLVAELKELWAR
ncbi:MAG: hypothetical protein R3C28_25160 [Pirellulaceae bacterium]